ncbi:enoyl-CoA hydratase-related protein [Rhodococcus sp. CX]|uniref:enoyl-CoA hydratase-related protein n=1 Tax=Rhodococcus sp. CX TaxID=2789880 RepID=UPI0027DE8533|nr:enoyl-CoA hydratase-related protein [Rhodococcus sp. CX]
MGGGCEIALACDLVVASTTARFALPETRRGVVATSGALFRAMRVLPLPIVKQMLITGFGLSAERAYHFGLVNAVAEPGNAVSEALALAEDICQSSPVAVRESLLALAAQFDHADEIGWSATNVALNGVMDSDDVKEGVRAFFERRRPEWSGR